MMRPLSLLFLPLLLLSLSSCSSVRCCYPRYGLEELVSDSYIVRQGKSAVMEMQGVEFDELDPRYFAEYRDEIGEGDTLAIALYHPTREDLIAKFDLIDKRVGFRVINGKLDLPDIPPVTVVGLTLMEAKQAVQSAYGLILDGVEIFLDYRKRPVQKVDIIGKVQQRQLPVDGRLRLFEGLSLAGLGQNVSFFESYVVRDGNILPIDFERLIVEGDERYNIVLRAGDKIFIADIKDAKASVMGEVYHPTSLELPFGSMPLRDALVEAGGIAETGNPNYILLIRPTSFCPKLYTLSWNEIACMPPSSLLLIAGDLVYVEETPIAAWNRFVSQLFPTFSLFERGHGAYRTCCY